MWLCVAGSWGAFSLVCSILLCEYATICLSILLSMSVLDRFRFGVVKLCCNEQFLHKSFGGIYVHVFVGSIAGSGSLGSEVRLLFIFYIFQIL